MEKAREHQIDLYMCFIDYKKAFDCVDHEILWVVLRDMGVPVHLIVLLRRLYTNQEATVRTEFGETDNIDIGKGVRQGCILSPLLFNIYAENITREALEEWERGIRIGGMMVRPANLRYATDTTLLAGTKENLIYLVETFRRASEKAGLYLNVGETKVMTIGLQETSMIGEVTVDGKPEGYRGSNEIRFLGSVNDQGRNMREGRAKTNSYGKSRNGRANINMEGQRSIKRWIRR